ncbi:MAG: FAD:protein FMN transferase, partial [Clostridia bacterium]|nr:FAD:protein FMN transferase [Clostridia bacterium]
SSIVCKEHYVNCNYTLGFYNPRSILFDNNYATTAIKNTCLSTSGDYEQNFILDGVLYCHVFDPTTGKPVQTGIMTATIVGGAAAEGDALTTAIMAMGKQRAVQFINEKLSDRKVAFTYDNNGAYEIITNIPSEEITVISEDFKIVNTFKTDKFSINKK